MRCCTTSQSAPSHIMLVRIFACMERECHLASRFLVLSCDMKMPAHERVPLILLNLSIRTAGKSRLFRFPKHDDRDKSGRAAVGVR